MKAAMIDQVAPDGEEAPLTKLCDEDEKERRFPWVNSVLVHLYDVFISKLDRRPLKA